MGHVPPRADILPLFQWVKCDTSGLKGAHRVLPDGSLIVFVTLTPDMRCLYDLAMMQSYSVSQLAQRVAPTAGKAEVAQITRQLRHWTLTGVLKPLGATHTGAGRHRRYSGDAVHVAALLIELSRLGLPVGVLHLIALGLMGTLRPVRTRSGKPSISEQQTELWRHAITGERTIHLTFNVRFDAEGAKEGGLALYDADEPDAPSPITEGHVSAIVVDLTQLFEPLRAKSGVESEDAAR